MKKLIVITTIVLIVLISCTIYLGAVEYDAVATSVSNNLTPDKGDVFTVTVTVDREIAASACSMQNTAEVGRWFVFDEDVFELYDDPNISGYDAFVWNSSFGASSTENGGDGGMPIFFKQNVTLTPNDPQNPESPFIVGTLKLKVKDNIDSSVFGNQYDVALPLRLLKLDGETHYNIGTVACQITPTCVNHDMVWGADNEGHWSECTSCGATTSKAAHTEGTHVAQKDPTCSATGTKAHYFCDVCDYYIGLNESIAAKALEDESFVIARDTDAHAWSEPEYSWSADNLRVTATRICSHNGFHKEVESAAVTPVVTQPFSPCTTNELTTYTSAVFTNPAFEVQVKENVVTKVAGHQYSELVERVAPTCKDTGMEAHYTCSVCNNYFTSEKVQTTQTNLIIAIDVNAHSYGSPTYVWAQDYSTLTATRVCVHNSQHTETETVAATSGITQIQSCTTPEITTHTSAAFTNSAFSVQVKDIKTKDALEHDWNAPTYEWAEDNSEVVATMVCKRNANHIATETVEAKKEVTQAQSCVLPELTKYTASFENPAFAEQTKENVQTKDAAGHVWSDYKSDANNHWKECTTDGCTAKRDEAVHSGGSATCTSKAKCSVCNAEYGALAVHDYVNGKCTMCEELDPGASADTDDAKVKGCRSALGLGATWLVFVAAGAGIAQMAIGKKRKDNE